MADVVRTELDLVALFCRRWRTKCYPGVEEEDVEALGLGEEGCCSLFNGGERAQVEGKQDDIDRWVTFEDRGA